MKVFDSTTFELPLPDTHRFPMSKYRHLADRVRLELPEIHMEIAPKVSQYDLEAIHDKAYVDRVLTGKLSDGAIRRIGFPWSPQLVERSMRSVGATIAASEAALDDGISVNLAGGTHHAHIDYGSGFCVFNDIAVAAKRLFMETEMKRIAIIDCDVHQGDGTARIFESHDCILTCSIHAAKNFPFKKATSDLDIALPKGTQDEAYRKALSHLLTEVQQFEPEFVFYLAGADPFEADALGHLSLTKTGLLHRDQDILDWCNKNRLPVAIAMGGGYATNVEDIVDIHFNTVQLALTYASSFNGIT